MKQFLLIIAIIGLFSYAEIKKGTITGSPGMHRQTGDSAALAGEWYLQPVLASDTAAGKLPVLRFNLAQKKFTGFTGCNQMSGAFRIVSDQLQFDKDITVTKIECEGYNEKEFLINLLRVDHYKIREGVLWLMIGQAPISKWMRKPGSKDSV
jgi:heat shock protein HslJ